MLGDPEALAFAGGVAVAIVLLHVGKGGLGRLALLLLFLNTVFWMFTAGLSNVRHGEDLGNVVIPVALATSSAVGLVAVLGSWLGRAERAAPAVAVLGVLAFAAALAVAVVRGLDDPTEPRPGDLVVDTDRAAFLPDSLTARAGEVAVVLDNDDLFWHTLTIDELDVDLRAPVGARRRATFVAEPGTYDFYCAVPGHRRIGMEGILTVR